MKEISMVKETAKICQRYLRDLKRMFSHFLIDFLCLEIYVKKAKKLLFGKNFRVFWDKKKKKKKKKPKFSKLRNQKR